MLDLDGETRQLPGDERPRVVQSAGHAVLDARTRVSRSHQGRTALQDATTRGVPGRMPKRHR
jgi:hypothetical protein